MTSLEITITVAANPGENVHTRVKATAVETWEVGPMLRRAIAGLLAELAALPSTHEPGHGRVALSEIDCAGPIATAPDDWPTEDDAKRIARAFTEAFWPGMWEDDADQDAEAIEAVRISLRTLTSPPANVALLVQALEAFIAENADYMRRNNLGDPEKQHTTKQARQALAAFKGGAK